jgi:hypothetical protein
VKRILQLVVVLAVAVAGAILRFQPMPARAAGGGLLIVAFLLLAYWARYNRR